MAGIDRSDTIRRPSDSTLSARSLHRGQEGVLRAQPQVLETLREQSPVVAVVVDQKNLGSDRKPLFDLLLSVNNQVVQARSERPLPAGTVLLIEVTPDNTLKVIPNPRPEQLNRMMQASLNFWQAHTLPRVHATQLPPLPDAPARAQLATDLPALRPLLDWLNQAPPLNRATLVQWVREFMPLNGGGASPQPQQGSQTNRPLTGQPPASPALTPTLTQTVSQARSEQPGALRPLAVAVHLLRPALTATSLEGAVFRPLPVAAQANSTPTAAGETAAVRLVAQAPGALRLDAQQPFARVTAPASPVGISPAPTATPVTVSANRPTATTPTDWRPLPTPGKASGRVPIEIRLGQWLSLIDEGIRQHPASLRQSLSQQATQLLNSPAGDYLRQAAASAPQSRQGSSGEELQPLLQLRNWAEAVQGKTQNNAIQQALSAFAQGDSQAVHQLSIPLIWLGPSAWMNLEWWQEKEHGSDADEANGGKRLWRFRLFFELTPLAPLCADLVWEPDKTQVTFWSQDQNTLAFLNQHMNTLEQWTEGLGERELLTRHGMPRKKSTPDPDQFKPLVDIRT